MENLKSYLNEFSIVRSPMAIQRQSKAFIKNRIYVFQSSENSCKNHLWDRLQDLINSKLCE